MMTWDEMRWQRISKQHNCMCIITNYLHIVIKLLVEQNGRILGARLSKSTFKTNCV